MIQKRHLILFFLFIALAVSNCELKAEKSFLWKVESGKTTCYVLGSVHLLKKENYPLNPVIENAFDQCDKIALEADVFDPEKLMAMANITLSKAIYKEDETLDKNLSEKNYQLVKEKLKAYNMDIEGLKKYKPWMISMMILQVELQKLGFQAEYGVDHHFYKKAKNLKEIYELEGVELQLNLFDSLTKEENEMLLISTIMEADKSSKNMDIMVKAWSTGNIEAMEKIWYEGIEKEPKLKEFNKRLNDNRNIGMAEKIASYMEEGKKVFVIAGAIHMVGKNGIIQLLKNKGYKVTQL